MIKILIVDDSVFSQKITANLINKHLENIEISFAGDGQEGFLKYKEINPDYVLLDLLMPKISGKELIEMIKEFDKAAKIFVISADVQKNVREEIEAYNIIAFINKPLNDEKVQDICNIIKDNKNDW